MNSCRSIALATLIASARCVDSFAEIVKEGEQPKAVVTNTEAPPLPPTNNLHPIHSDELQRVELWQRSFENAREQRISSDPNAEANLQRIINHPDAPQEFRRLALLELAYLAQGKKEFVKAQNAYAEYTSRYSEHPSTTEVLLRQGLLYRDMGAHELAIAKFYAVMSNALKLKLDEVGYYKRLVLQAQTEIADTYYLQGRFKDAAELFQRVLKLDSPDINKAMVSYKLIRSLASDGRNDEVVALGQQFVANYTNSIETAEVHFLLANSCKKLGRNREAIDHVNALLSSQQELARENPEQWTYWQQRAGNEIANQLYKEGDFMNALQVYRALASLDDKPAWQVPVWYQMGLVYERLKQPQKAVEIYTQMIAREPKDSTNAAPPALAAIYDMARWRGEHLQWVTNAEAATRQFSSAVRADKDPTQ